MAVKIRLTRMGAKKAPFYRIVAMDSRKARDGQYIEQIGYYDPTKEPMVLSIDKDIAKKWLNNGAQPTDTVRRLFKDAGLIERSTAPELKPGQVEIQKAKKSDQEKK